MRYQNYREQDMQDVPNMARTMPSFAVENQTWDARHLTKFLNSSQYSNWRNVASSVRSSSSITSPPKSRTSSSVKNDYFFRTTKDDKNQSKIGFTPIFPLVTNSTLQPKNQTLRQFFNESQMLGFKQGYNTQRSGHFQQQAFNKTGIKLRCRPSDKFKYEGNTVKYKQTDPVTLQHESPHLPSNFQSVRRQRLIQCRHPHGMTGLDHQQNPQTQFYKYFNNDIKVRQQPNSHTSFDLSRDWKSKGKVPHQPQALKNNRSCIRKYRNQNLHGYNILTNRKI